MNKFSISSFYLVLLIVAASIFGSCKDDPVLTDYIRVTVVPPKAPLITPSIRVHRAQGVYDTDDAAIKKETELLYKLQEDYYKKAVSASPGQESIFIDMFKDVRDGQHYLLKITHKESNDLEELIKIIEDHGIEATEAKDYCRLNGIEFDQFVLEPLKMNDLLQEDNPNPLIGKYYCERSRDYYILKSDNTGTFITSGQPITIKWKQKGKNVTILFDASDPVTLRFDEKAKTLEESSKEAMEIFGTKLIFRKQE